MTSYMSKDQGNFGLSVRDCFKLNVCFFLQLQATDTQTEVLTAALMIFHTNTGDVCVCFLWSVFPVGHTHR